MSHHSGTDLRDLYRSGSGMTLRRVYVLIKGLPPEAALWHEMQAAQEEYERSRVASKLHDRANYYARLRDQQTREREAANG